MVTMVRYNFLFWNFLLVFLEKFPECKSLFLCKNFYNNATTTLTSKRNDSIRLSVFRTSHYVPLETAEKVCRLCLDNGSLVQHDDIRQLLPYMPLWIGITTDPNVKMANKNDWTWLDGTKLNQSEKNVYASSIYYPESFIKHEKYGFYAFPDNWNAQNIETLGQFPYVDSDRKMSNRTGMKWIALINNAHSMIYVENIRGLTGEERWKMLYLMRYIVCERPLRQKCHFWNYTEECQMDKDFGCHTYLNMMFLNSDNTSEKCQAPQQRRMAKRCRNDSCTCAVTQWGEWSACGNEVCSLTKLARIRHRQQTDYYCPRINIHPSLNETEPCQIPGCDALLHDDECNDDADCSRRSFDFELN